MSDLFNYIVYGLAVSVVWMLFNPEDRDWSGFVVSWVVWPLYAFIMLMKVLSFALPRSGKKG